MFKPTRAKAPSDTDLNKLLRDTTLTIFCNGFRGELTGQDEDVNQLEVSQVYLLKMGIQTEDGTRRRVIYIFIFRGIIPSQHGPRLNLQLLFQVFQEQRVISGIAQSVMSDVDHSEWVQPTITLNEIYRQIQASLKRGERDIIIKKFSPYVTTLLLTGTSPADLCQLLKDENTTRYRYATDLTKHRAGLSIDIIRMILSFVFPSLNGGKMSYKRKMSYKKKSYKKKNKTHRKNRVTSI